MVEISGPQTLIHDSVGKETDEVNVGKMDGLLEELKMNMPEEISVRVEGNSVGVLSLHIIAEARPNCGLPGGCFTCILGLRGRIGFFHTSFQDAPKENVLQPSKVCTGTALLVIT
ncbi:hypothetical protein JTE90_011334 [Oedothorax gibbosus]|uniref:Uncharacterized protein n=1 Tax=Oedothorax gibbosus TaxID=931172 RepID=A0AAV6VN63_9ARAC|nr:hypothetical protein JTE90_011334 [Oedothorax gibbosus]